MRPNLEARLKRIEDRTPRPEKLSCKWELLTTPELLRVYGAGARGLLTRKEFKRWIKIARAREAAGLTADDVRERFPSHDGSSSLEASLARRLNYSGYDLLHNRFDAVDLTKEEVAMVCGLIERVPNVEELYPFEEVICRTWWDSQPLSIHKLADLVLSGKLPNQPPPEFQQPIRLSAHETDLSA
jgi:hypothetical protein